jgi:hypothetical protein
LEKVQKSAKKAQNGTFHRVKKSKIAFFCRFWEKKNPFFLTFPNCFGKVGKSDFPKKHEKGLFIFFSVKGEIVDIKVHSNNNGLILS